MLEGVTRTFGALHAIEDVSFSVAAGERRAVIGANGAGKTTLFNVDHRRLPGHAGRVRFFGEDVTTLPPYERIRMGLRRTYQSSLLFRDLTVRDNLFLAVRGVARNRFSFLGALEERPGRRAPRSRAAHPVADHPVAALSHGQQRQLEIGMALAGAPRLILFDEPAAGLSPAERARAGGAARAPARAHRLHPDRARPGHRAPRGRPRHRAPQRPRAQGRQPAEIENDPEVQAIYMGDRAR